MKRILVGAFALALSASPAFAQSLEDLNIQIHGYATQGFLYTTNNNIFTTSSSDGSPAWTEAVVNVTAQPDPKLRVGVQARYFLLGNFGNAITLDWANADYKVNDKFGVRFGKVKTPSGLFNEIQDIDPSYLWALLPQSVYPLTSRNSFLAQYGGVVYGTLALPQKLGKLEYRAWSGEHALNSDDGALLNLKESGTALPDGIKGVATGGAIHWKTPFQGLMVGASDIRSNTQINSTTLGNGAFTGTQTVHPYNTPDYFAKYEKGKILLAYEYARNQLNGVVVAPSLAINFRFDQREQYAMASYKVTDKLTTGAYFSYFFNQHEQNLSPNFQKDYTVAGRYDFNQFLYAKAEQHFINGTALSFDTNLNSSGLKANSKLTILKIGVSF
jgi:hypothetical protein